jgi:GDP-L-fucose synthase
MDKDSKIYIAGHNGLVGSAILKLLKEEGYSRLIRRSHKELDPNRQSDVEKFFEIEKPEYVILAATKVGGINANSTYPAQFIYQNPAIAMKNVSKTNKARKLITQ